MDLIKSPQKFAKSIDQTNLNRDATKIDIKRLCDAAKEHNFGCICVNPIYVPLSKELLKDSDVKVCTVVGFPLGANMPKIKFFEATDAIRNGADEIDMVMNIGALKSGFDEDVKKDISGVVAAAEGKTVKVILETGLLTKEEKIRACKAAEDGGANFVKTSTGFGISGATVEDVALLRENVGQNIGVKASGGINDLQIALDMIKAGATRIGTSNGVKIMEELLKSYG